MTQSKILVTAAAGHTGSATVLQLLEMGFPVRAFVRRKDARSVALARAGAEIFVGDMFDYRDLRDSMAGVQRAYHCPPFAANLLHNTMAFAIAAEEAKLEVVALMSQWNPHPSHPSVISREHWMTNQVFRWMPSVDVIHINPGLFAFVAMLGLPAIAHFGMFMGPFGDGLNAPPSNEDIARVAAAVLADPASHIGKSYRPTSSKLISPNDMAKTMGKVLGRKVTYKDVPFKTFSKAAIALGYSLPEIAHLRYYSEELRNGAFAVGGPTDHVLQVTGRQPEDFETIARRYIQDPALIHPNLKVGSKLSAIAFLFKMMGTRPPNFPAWERQQNYPLLDNPVLSQDSDEWLATAERQQLNLLPNLHSTAPALALVS